MSGRKEGRVERGPPAEAAAEGSQRPPLPAPLTPRSSTGGPRLRIPSHDRRAGRGWRRPGGRPPRDGVARPSASSREGRAGGPHPPQPAPGRPPKSLSPPGLLAVSSDVSRPPPRCRLGDVVPGCEALGSSRATQLCGLRPCLLEGTNASHRPCRSQARAGVDGD
ncbi:uncharacterized protein LOC143273971 [Peromyscus maniculatus bairdii]|uniref:uncharacterized protein LOC143273971 n=1 Tax=Peromyscus maniculatus bairdii TaxID=230844 RepID=UPI003FD29847